MFTGFGLLDLSTPDLTIILAIILLLFGSKKLPELSRSLGQSARELRNGMSDAKSAHAELKEQVSETTATIKSPVAFGSAKIKVGGQPYTDNLELQGNFSRYVK